MPTRDDAYLLMTTHVKNENLQKHMLAVEAAMRFYAHKYGENEEIWAMTGLLHDCDYEKFPDLREHTLRVRFIFLHKPPLEQHRSKEDA